MGKQFYLKGSILHAPNGFVIGVVDKNDDGYYHYWPSWSDGYVSSYHLKAIADLLDNLNEEWDAIVQKEIGDE